MKQQARASSPMGDRLAGLAPAARSLMQQALIQINRNAPASAATLLTQVLVLAPTHPEALRLLALVRYRSGAQREAVGLLRRALETWPDDAVVLSTLGGLLGNFGETEEALALLRHACDADPNLAAAWFNLGRLLNAQAEVEGARDALQRTLELADDHLPARVLHASVLAALGDTAAAAAQYRRAISIQPDAAQAWLGLVNLKTVRLDATESATLAGLHAAPGMAEAERTTIAFALGKVREDEQRYAEAYALFDTANAAMRRRLPWDAAAFSHEVDAITAAFAHPQGSNGTDLSLGREVIFIVSLPRSGSTLVEQILAAHAQVEGASELPDLEAVIEEESRRRKLKFPHWAAQATAADWRRLGLRYLERTQRWRSRRGRFTDKMPDNWRLVGAALAMLPGARVINCRRDPVETCWSCFKQLFGPGRQRQSYNLADLAAYWHDYDRLSRHWQALDPLRVREFEYEILLANPAAVVRQLLDFCELPFDEACLHFHAAARPVRTASAAQVREPLRTDTRRSPCYGNLLDPLRGALERPPAAPLF
ncbi:MAG: sulfotransferase [Dokdonella sp.]